MKLVCHIRHILGEGEGLPLNCTTSTQPKYNLWNRLQWLFEPWVEDAPKELDFCEYECRRPRCTAHSLDTCELRLDRPATLAAMAASNRSYRSYPKYRP